MGYATPDQVRLVLQSTTAEQGGTAADLSDSQIQYEIDTASAIIDATLRNNYEVPFTDPAPTLITSICVDIAAFGADLNYRKSREYQNQLAPIILRYNKAINNLNLIRSGDLELDTPRSDISNFGALVVNQYPWPLFGFDDVYGYRARW